MDTELDNFMIWKLVAVTTKMLYKPHFEPLKDICYRYLGKPQSLGFFGSLFYGRSRVKKLFLIDNESCHTLDVEQMFFDGEEKKL